MTILEYIRDYLPKFFKVHPSYGKVAEWIYLREKSLFFKFIKGNPFSYDKFSSTRERARFGIPYQVCDSMKKERKNKINILELVICIHRQKVHKEDHKERIEFLYDHTDMTQEENQMLKDIQNNPTRFWSG